MYKSVKSSVFVFSGLMALIAGVIAPTTVSAAVGCTSANTVMYVVAHEDDALLFQNPSMQKDISAGKCVETVFITAGDAGSNSTPYWVGRENGAKAASAFMAGVANTWTQADAGVSGHAAPRFTLTANPKVTLVFLRLPDGNLDGSGFPATGNKSLQSLWQNTTASIATVDGFATYTRQDLIDALNVLMVNSNPSRINTQDFINSFGEGDHSDHYATALFTKAAHVNFKTIHSLHSYYDYLSWQLPVNVFGDDFTANKNAFFSYASHDSHVCQNEASCAGGYLDWLDREYSNGSEEGGDVCSNIEGRQIEVPQGTELIEGQCVVIAPVSCEADVSSVNILSDLTDTVSTGGSAVETYAPDSWTANIPGATWIWNAFHVSNPSNGETLTFTKTFTLTGTALNGSITIASDDNYEASLNGIEFGSTTELNNFSTGNEDTYNVSALLVSGGNTLVITVHNMAMGIDDPTWNPAGLKYKLTFTKNSCTNTPPQVCPEGTTGTYPACVPVSTGGNSGGSAGSADSPYWGCTNASASNFNSLANKDDGSCVLPQGSTSGAVGGSGTTTGEVLGASTTTPELALPAGCSEYIHTYMGKGKKNDKEDVARLQTFLNETMGTNIPTNGFFGTLTKNLVKKFQVKYHAEIIKPWVDAGYKGKDIENGTGYVYKTTKRQINLMKCSTLDIPTPDLSSDIGN